MKISMASQPKGFPWLVFTILLATFVMLSEGATSFSPPSLSLSPTYAPVVKVIGKVYCYRCFSVRHTQKNLMRRCTWKVRFSHDVTIVMLLPNAVGSEMCPFCLLLITYHYPTNTNTSTHSVSDTWICIRYQYSLDTSWIRIRGVSRKK
jgi:hypothetical protein